MFLDKLFKRKIVSSEIVNSNIYGGIPSLEELDEVSKEIVNKYQEEYKLLFKTVFSTIDLDKDLMEEIKLYQELVLNELFKDNFGELLESKISSIKLGIYAEKYKEINEILKYKYIALREIKKDKKYLSLHNRLYFKAVYKVNITELINNYENTLYNLIATITDKIFKCISICAINNPKIDLYKDELEKKYNKVNGDYKRTFNKEIPLNENDSIVYSLALAEIELEKYALANKDKLVEYKNRLVEISNNDIKDITERDLIIEELMEIKKNYIIFSKYGRNIIKESELDELYQIIFNVYTYFPYDNKFSEYYSKCRVSKLQVETDFYRNIIKHKLNQLKLRKSTVFINHPEYGDEVVEKIANIMKWYQIIVLKDDNDIFNPYDAIIRKNLYLLLSLDYLDGLDNYFEKLKYMSMVKSSDNSGYIINPYDNFLLDWNKYEDIIDLYNSIFFIDKSILSKENLDCFSEDVWKQYIKNCGSNIIYIPNNYSKILLNCDNIPNDIIYVLPNDIKYLNLNFLSAHVMHKRVVIPRKINNELKILWTFPRNRGSGSVDIYPWLDTIFKTFIFDDRITNYGFDELYYYFYKIFKFIEESLELNCNNVDDAFNRIQKAIVDNLSYMSSSGTILKVFYSKDFADEICDLCEYDKYEISPFGSNNTNIYSFIISFLTISVLEFYEKNQFENVQKPVEKVKKKII